MCMILIGQQIICVISKSGDLIFKAFAKNDYLSLIKSGVC